MNAKDAKAHEGKTHINLDPITTGEHYFYSGDLIKAGLT
jgi:hypothetical protein